MVSDTFLIVLAVAAAVAAVIWARGVAVRWRHLRGVEAAGADQGVLSLSRQSLLRELHAVAVYGVVSATAVIVAVGDGGSGWYALAFLAVPILATFVLARYAKRDVRHAERQARVEQRANELLTQEDSAPRMWAERLAPRHLPDTHGFSVGTAHQAGSGLMTGDLLDAFRLPSGHLCSVVGDVTGHGVEASITALQTKFLLRSYLRRYRDPGQALEELNSQMSDFERPEEFVSVCVAIFDEENDTLRYASAGHPAAWLTQDRTIRSLRDTGPLLMMERGARYSSKELTFSVGDVLVMITDGLIEARSSSQMFGEERLASLIRRDVDVEPDVLCKTLIDAAVDFADGPVADDVTVMVVRRV